MTTVSKIAGQIASQKMNLISLDLSKNPIGFNGALEMISLLKVSTRLVHVDLGSADLND